ncbi:MATE family efflux transporter [Oscillibacter sp. MSJ-2]|uniref:MATE family efflux transporter n=1 Tax=Dysosmobacter acutus TaxID=2841504 RepID=A0ABS6FCQ9_9FIRM|nr:MATE family efflux transporter [Dysosmobacter acutus]MBU5627942.1 MATE family efflux transporter [Dysosmobacter acutus]
MEKEEKVKTYEMDMCTGVVWKKMLVFAFPLVCSNVLQLLFNAADIVVVGRFAGDNSLAAVGSNSSLIHLLINLFVGLSVGANVLAARSFGSHDDKTLGEVVHTAMLMSIVSGLFLALVGSLGARQVLVWMKTPDEVLGLAALYLRIYFLGMPATMIYNFGSALLRAVGDTKRPLNYLTVAGVVNVVLNLFFVIALHLDVAGVAIATVVSQCISAFLVMRCLMRESGGIRLDLKLLRIHKRSFLQIIKIGLPAGFQGILFSVSNVVIQSSINTFGEVVMAGNSAANNIENFVYFAMNAFYQASISFTGQNFGAGQYKRIYRILLASQAFVVILGVVFGNLVYLCGTPLLQIYSKSPAVIAAGLDRMKIISRTYALGGMMDVMVGCLRGIGYSVMPMIVSLVGSCLLRLVWISTIFQIPQYHTIETVYISYPITWAITLTAHILCFLWAMRRLERRAAQPDDPNEPEPPVLDS